MTNIKDIFDISHLREEIALGFVSEREHPHWPDLKILNYTPEAQYSRRWNDVTRITRGLIYNSATGVVLARPFPKIHNWDEAEAPPVAWDQALYHWDNKWDGSLGIVYHTPAGGLAVATRGSFASEQAEHASAWLNARPEAQLEAENFIDMGYTPLYEIIYPDNRIVLNYGDMDELVHLGSIHMQTGAFLPANPQPQRLFSGLQGDLSRGNSEGWVAWVNSYKAVKIKQADYVELHRIVSSLNEKEVWRQKKAGTYDTFIVNLPDEFYEWATGVGEDLQAAFDMESGRAADYAKVVSDKFTERKEQAQYIQKTYSKTIWGDIFAALDGKDTSEGIWRRLEPKNSVFTVNSDE
ncbi:MAG: RNA ligase [Cetobacterium sp.]